MPIKIFQSVVIKNGCILGHMTGKMMVAGEVATTVFDLMEQPLNSEINFNLTQVDASRLRAVSGWGEITHIYEIQDEAPIVEKNNCVANLLQATKKSNKRKAFAGSLIPSVIMA